MGRPVMLSNGQMMVGLDERGLVHDFYYPYVGLDNLTTAHSAHHKIGVWVDGNFSWVDGFDWTIEIDSESDALISRITMTNTNLGVRFDIKDFVDNDHNGFIRRINVTNIASKHADVRVFMHQVFQISRAGRADTALFVPDTNYVLDYKGRCALLVYGQTDDGLPFDQYAVGNYEIEGKAGTFVDAEDGELSGNAVEHGGVDSVIRFKLELEPNQTRQINYWIIAEASQYECETVHSMYINDGIDSKEQSVRAYWSKWLSIGADGLHMVDKEYLNLAKKSLMIIKAHTDRRGGVLASGDSSIFNYGRDYYCYCWPRDGAYAMWPLIRLGYTEEPKNFFEFCRDTLDRNGYLMHKYQPDRAIGSTWHPLVHDRHKELAIQEDETAVVICMLGEFFDHCNESEFVQSLYSTLIKPAADFMSTFIDTETNLPHASYDIWEEKFLTHTYTSAIVEHALRRASKFAEAFDYPNDSVVWQDAANKIHESMELLFDQERQTYRKGLYLKPDGSLEFDNTLDASSLYGIWMFTQPTDENEALASTFAAIEKELTNLGPAGGVVRYENDWYMRTDAHKPPNGWFVCSFWMAQYYMKFEKFDKAKQIIDWSLKLALPSGVFSEQIDTVTGQQVSVAPLVWSHAEFVNTVLDMANEHKVIVKRR